MQGEVGVTKPKQELSKAMCLVRGGNGRNVEMGEGAGYGVEPEEAARPR